MCTHTRSRVSMFESLNAKVIARSERTEIQKEKKKNGDSKSFINKIGLHNPPHCHELCVHQLIAAALAVTENRNIEQTAKRSTTTIEVYMRNEYVREYVSMCVYRTPYI